MGVNVLLFVVVQIGLEPWRRKRLVRGFEEKVKEVVEGQATATLSQQQVLGRQLAESPSGGTIVGSMGSESKGEGDTIGIQQHLTDQRHNSTLTPMRAKVPHVDALRIL